jgi:catechol 2,3-dioxygenase-like lactoylglutathione lyase family enzyme
MDRVLTGTLHHVELWVADLDRAADTWGWLLTELGYEQFQEWPGGRSWRAGATYIAIEQSPDRTAVRHDRCRPGLNHLAFHVADRDRVDELTKAAQGHGWRLMFADKHPYAGGDSHYAAYLENVDGFEAELVAIPDETAELGFAEPGAGAGAGIADMLATPAGAEPAGPAEPAQTAEPAESAEQPPGETAP